MRTLFQLLLVIGLLLIFWHIQSNVASWADVKSVELAGLQDRLTTARKAKEDRESAEGAALLAALHREREAMEDVLSECRKSIEHLRRKPYRYPLNETEKEALSFLETTRREYEELVAANERARRVARLYTPAPREPRALGLAYRAVIRQHVVQRGGTRTANNGLVTNWDGRSLLVECGPRVTNDGGVVGECLLVGFPRADEMTEGQTIEFRAHRSTTASIPRTDGSVRPMAMLIYSIEGEAGK